MNMDSCENLAFDGSDLLFPRPQSSVQIKSVLGRYHIREKSSIDCSMHQEAEQYKTNQRLALVYAQSLTVVAQFCADAQKDQETQLLLKFASSGDSSRLVGLESAVHLARAARDALVSEEQLALCKRKESQVMLTMRGDTFDEFRVLVSDASRQYDELLIQSGEAGVDVPYENGTSKPVPFKHLSAYKSQLNAYLQAEQNFDENGSNVSAGGSTYSEESEDSGEDPESEGTSHASSTDMDLSI